MDALIQLPEPHSKKQQLIMNATRIEGLTEIWVACGTKFGKTMAGVGSYCSLFPRLNDGIIRHIAPVYTQSLVGMRYAQKFLPGKPHIKPNISGMPSIKWADERKHSRIEFRNGQDPESLEGDGTIFNLLDEGSKMKRQVYDSTRTTVTQTRGLIASTSTPRGKNWWYACCMNAKAEMEWCMANDKPLSKIFITAQTHENPYVTKESIEEARKNLPDRLFRQYFLAEFVDAGEVFPFFKDAVYGHQLVFQYESQVWFHANAAEEDQVVVGCDWGKQDDYCVFTAWAAQSKLMIGFMRFRGIDYISAIKNLIWFCDKYKQLLIVKHDKTGLGNVMDDALANTNLPYEGVTFTMKSKSAMINSMMLAFQRHDVKIPNWPAMIEELDSFEVQVNEIGNMKYSAPSGFHDDIVCSMFLGWFGVEEYAPTKMEVVSLDELADLDLDTEDFGPTETDFTNWEAVTK